MPEEVEQIARLGVKVRLGVTIGKDVTVDELWKNHTAVFLGIGMGDDMPAKIPGEDLPGVWESLRFIEALKLCTAGGVGIGKRVAVIGGGNTAIDVAREAVMLRNSEVSSSNTAVDVARQARMLGAAEVMMLYRRSEAEMPAFAHEIEAAKHEGVTIIPLVAPVEFVSSGGRVSGIKCVKMRLGPPDASGRPKPEPIPGSEYIIEADTVIKAIGQKPHTELLSLFGVEMKGSVVKVDGARTSTPRVYAGGDCINGGATVVEAVRDGREAARTIDRDLMGTAPPKQSSSPPMRVEKIDGTVRHFQSDYRLTTAPRLCKGCNVCVTGCPTGTLKLDSTNHIEVKDANTCVFCGLCEARCPDFAIWIVKGESGRARINVPESEAVS
jgi:glutamate synthase (NADPH/NADH) small chain